MSKDKNIESAKQFFKQAKSAHGKKSVDFYNDGFHIASEKLFEKICLIAKVESGKYRHFEDFRDGFDQKLPYLIKSKSKFDASSFARSLKKDLEDDLKPHNVFFTVLRNPLLDQQYLTKLLKWMTLFSSA